MGKAKKAIKAIKEKKIKAEKIARETLNFDNFEVIKISLASPEQIRA